MATTEPIVERLTMPPGYGATTTALTWASVRERLERAKQYWLALNRPSAGSPYLTPVDGVWIDDMLIYGGSPATTHRKLVARNPDVAIHLPDPWEVVVVEGSVQQFAPSPDLLQRLLDAQRTKYPEYPIDESLYAEVLAVVPRRARAWTAFPKDCTGFTFPTGRPSA